MKIVETFYYEIYYVLLRRSRRQDADFTEDKK